ncbi:MAG: NADH:ubiquinone reductase (Na(+)-transporting) subunit B, partial [Candidatus Hydrogenedentota bacterium]
LFEAMDTFLFTPSRVTKSAPHVRDGLDLKRLMSLVVIALIPTIVMAFYNTGLQANKAIAAGAPPLDRWQTSVMEWLGLGFTPDSILSCAVYGGLFFVPVLLVTYIVGGLAEVLFSIVRRHEVNEGFLVTGMLFPLILPPTVPMWQVVVGILFGVIVGKEIFGGTGMNFLNPALTARAFIFFAYPASFSGDRVWIAAQTWEAPDAVSGATWLAKASEEGQAAFANGVTWWDAFIGFIPGSMGETSVLACLLGAILLRATWMGSWRIMVGVLLGSFVMTGLLNIIGSDTNPMFEMPWHWHLVLGGFAFAVVYMATDPVSAAFTDPGRWVYGILIGVLGILIRVVNPGFPEGWMLAILFMNMFAPYIDTFVKARNIKRRQAGYAT